MVSQIFDIDALGFEHLARIKRDARPLHGRFAEGTRRVIELRVDLQIPDELLLLLFSRQPRRREFDRLRQLFARLDQPARVRPRR